MKAAFIVYEWILLAEEHARKYCSGNSVLVARLVPENEMRLEENRAYIDVYGAVVGVAARYMVEEEFTVEAGDARGLRQIVIPKIAGVQWVPLLTKTNCVFDPHGTIWVSPPPKAVLVLVIEPEGRTIVRARQWKEARR